MSLEKESLGSVGLSHCAFSHRAALIRKRFLSMFRFRKNSMTQVHSCQRAPRSTASDRKPTLVAVSTPLLRWQRLEHKPSSVTLTARCGFSLSCISEALLHKLAEGGVRLCVIVLTLSGDPEQ